MASVRSRKDSGLLFLDFRWQGRRYREQTALTDTAANRARLERVLARVEKQIQLGTFDYAAFFNKKRATPPAAPSIAPAPAETPQPAVDTAASRRVWPAAADQTPTFRDFVEQWIREHAVEWRRSHLRTLRSTIERHLLPRFGDVRVCAIRRRVGQRRRRSPPRAAAVRPARPPRPAFAA